MKPFPIKKLLFLILAFSLILACNKTESPISTNTGVNTGGNTNENEWLLPENQVLSGGPGKDGIPSVDSPIFETVDVVNYKSDDLILGIKVDGEIRGYPHPILDWHEIVNDEVNELNVAVTYCPLTGTGIGWNRNIDGTTTTFGVSGLLYNTNLIPYDRATESHWSQIRLDCVNGALIETKIEVVPLIEMTWATWKEMFPSSMILSTNTGFNRNYGNYPYGDYKTSNNLIFPVNNSDPALHKKERVLGVIAEDKAKIYRFDSFNEEKINIIFDEFEGVELIVLGSFTKEFMIVYRNELTDGSVLDWVALQDGGTEIAEDADGNRLNIFGEVVQGPKAGESLKPIENFMGYWFSWPAFYETSIYE